VLGREGTPFASLHTAVMASCAIPGFYQPVRVGDMTLVDGGAHSSTNLDLATAASPSPDLIIGVAPMAWDTAQAPCPAEQLPRRFAARHLASEAAAARARGAHVLLFRPNGYEVRRHGLNLMRRRGWEDVARMAYDSSARLLETPRFRDALNGEAASA
jgi:NTE family protein